MPPKPIKQRPTEAVRPCPHCGIDYNVRGWGMHKKACGCQQTNWDQPTSPIEVEDGGDFNINNDGMFAYMYVWFVNNTILIPRS